MVTFTCQLCKTTLQVDDVYAGELVRCPTCLKTLRAPRLAAAAPVGAATAPAAHVGTGAGAGATAVGATTGSATMTQPRRTAPPPPLPPSMSSQFRSPGGGKRYGFNCGYCSSRLEATESMAGQEGQCPTCGNNIVIPILDRYGRLIDPVTREIIKQDPHPVHAYAAAGERAPRILRQNNGNQVIQCPRCQSVSPITSNNCKSCGMPFTMEGTTLEAAGTSNGFCVASLVLGIIGIPAGCTGLAPLLAVIFGVVGYNQVVKSGSEGAGKGMAIAGIVCGVIGLLLFGYIVFN